MALPIFIKQSRKILSFSGLRILFSGLRGRGQWGSATATQSRPLEGVAFLEAIRVANRASGSWILCGGLNVWLER